MKIDISIVTYNGGGGHPVLSFVGDFLLLGAPNSFGSAITSVDMYAHLRSSRPAEESQEELRERFEERTKTLPLAWFKRKQFLFEIAYLSELGSAEDLFEQSSKSVSLSLFHDACREIVSAVSIMKKRLKKAADFDFDAFDSYLHRRLEQLPSSLGELETLLRELRAAEEQERKQRQIATPRGGSEEKRGAPKSVYLNHDDHSARYVGRTEDGRQFFLTTPFVPAGTPGCEPGREFLALYLFDKSGVLLSAIIDDLGPRATVDEAAISAQR